MHVCMDVLYGSSKMHNLFRSIVYFYVDDD